MVDTFSEQNKMALVFCVEAVLMRRGNTNYHLITAKLNANYNCTIMDCYENPEALRNVLKDVYKEDYNSIINEIKILLDELANVREIANFLRLMQS
ncbi:MAG: hypothetical protein AUI61_03355 [Thaumarchaeota archaeon 13_1_40CM_2_39_13_2]|nr:MAG: hypothetical protein AUI61_03355 [Thaumarchaeota archaeon 13_1_40CM_2_39_13_2]OLE40697.1 MAG: hypothetical protein AUG16_03070 [Thaumarchaeota archaeon 13_1_20CM_2_39_20]